MNFTWRDGERTIIFGRGVLDGAVEALGGPGYTLLTTERAAASAPRVAAAAEQLLHVPAGHVDHVAGELLGTTTGERLVALGGGRVIDVTKALVAARAGTARALAIPTTLSGAEMTTIHRHAAGIEESVARVRPAVVVFDPALAASQPVDDLAASSLNALGHAVEGPCTTSANPVATLAAREAIRLIGLAWGHAEPDRDTLALGALLAGYALDNSALGLHHVLAQTLVRVAGVGHGRANAAMLPHTIPALARRAALEDADELVALAERICTTGLRDLGVDPDVLEACADAAASRPQLKATPPPADRDEILALYQAAL